MQPFAPAFLILYGLPEQGISGKYCSFYRSLFSGFAVHAPIISVNFYTRSGKKNNTDGVLESTTIK